MISYWFRSQAAGPSTGMGESSCDQNYLGMERTFEAALNKITPLRPIWVIRLISALALKKSKKKKKPPVGKHLLSPTPLTTNNLHFFFFFLLSHSALVTKFQTQRTNFIGWLFSYSS